MDIICNNSPINAQSMYLHSYDTLKYLKNPGCFDSYWDCHQGVLTSVTWFKLYIGILYVM